MQNVNYKNISEREKYKGIEFNYTFINYKWPITVKHCKPLCSNSLRDLLA